MPKIRETKEALLSEYKTLAKKADRRLRSLEAEVVKNEGFKQATEWAYARAMRDIQTRFGLEATRFDKKLPKAYTKQMILGAISDVQTFLSSKSSTVTGIKQTYIKQADTMSKQLGTTVTAADIKALFDSGTWDKLRGKMTSAQIWKRLATLKKDASKIKKEIQEASAKTDYKPSAEEVRDAIMEKLAESEITSIDDLY